MVSLLNPSVIVEDHRVETERNALPNPQFGRRDPQFIVRKVRPVVPGDGDPGDDDPGNGTPPEGELPGGDTPGDDTPVDDTPSFDMPSTGGTPSFDTGSNDNVDLGFGTAEETKTFRYQETEYCTLTPCESMIISIIIDEMDILKIQVDSKVQVTLDALTGQSFEGTITEINSEGTNNGGNTKYSAEVSIDTTDNMLSGMNAHVNISLDSTDAAVTIPIAALVEQNGSVFVYTGYDEKNDTLTNPIEVTTGVSDGTNVEILSGLSADDTYYYKYADTITYTFVF